VRKAVPIAVAFGAVLLIGGGIAYNISHQRAQQDADRRQTEMEQKIAAMQRQLAAQSGGVAPGLSDLAGATTSTAPASFLQAQRLTSQVLQEGDKRLATQRPADAADAAKIYQEGIDKVDGQNPRFYLGLGHAHLILGRYSQALDAFTKAHDLAPSAPEPYSAQGWAYWNLKSYPAAKQAWEQAVAIDPKSIEAWSGLSWVYLALKRKDDALRGFNLLIFTMDRNDWKMGRNLAAGANFDLAQIRVNFPSMPDPAAFTAGPSATRQ
jgi:tetratricopeptide (TPR) repeat protein